MNLDSSTAMVTTSDPPQTIKAWRTWGLPLLLAFALGPVGCGVQEPSSSQSRFRLADNPLFSHVEIIGSRGTALGMFNKPRSLTVDLQDNLYAVDLTGRVQKFSPDGNFLLSWQMPETDLGKPKGMTRDAQGHIVVIEPHYARINHFTPLGELVSQWGSGGTNLGQFTVPRAVTTTADGTLLICEYSRVDRVQAFHAESRKLKFTFGNPGSAQGEFNRPEGLVVDLQGRIYVADSCNHRIQVFSPEGQWLGSFGSPGTGPGHLSYPYDIAADQQGRLFVCEFGNSRIQVFDAEYQPLTSIGSFGKDPGQFHNPWMIEFDSLGNLYVADGANHRVQKLIARPGIVPVGTPDSSKGSSARSENRRAGLR